MPAPFNNKSQFWQDLNELFKWQSLAQRCKVFYENKQFVVEAVKNDGKGLSCKALIQVTVYGSMVQRFRVQ
jgi:hypothetical protein